MKKTKKITFLFSIIISISIIPIHTSPQKMIVHTSTYFSNIVQYISYVKCLSISIYFLSCLHKKNYYYKPCNIIEKEGYIQIDTTFFFHHSTKFCLQKVLRTGSLKPIITLLQKTSDQLNSQSPRFIHEIFLLIFTVYKQILLQECNEHHHVLKKTTLTTIIEVSDKINQLPIAEVLSAIDMLMTELPPFLEKYELTSTITWKNWLKKYWWVPPVFGGWFALRILLSFQQSYFYRHGYPRPPHPSMDTVITDPELLNLKRDKDTNQK